MRQEAGGGPDSGNPSVQEGSATLRAPTVSSSQEHKLNLLITHAPGTLNALSGAEWEDIDIGVDSGASDTVVNEAILANVPVVEGEHKRKGVQYDIATGQLIPNLGEKKFVGVSENLVERG